MYIEVDKDNNRTYEVFYYYFEDNNESFLCKSYYCIDDDSLGYVSLSCDNN